MSSGLYPNELIINDETHWREWHPSAQGFGTGWIKPENVGYGATAKQFPKSLLLPWDEINRRAAEREANKTQLSHKILASGMKPLNQQNTNFCFANAPVNAARVLQMLNNQPYVELSPASLACRVTGFRNVGGFAGDVLEIMQTDGVMPASIWPVNAIDQRYNTKENWEQAKPFIIPEWITLEPENLQQRASLNVQDIGVCVAYGWWEHEVYGCDYLPDGTFRDWNSWGDYGDRGFFLVGGNKRYFADGVAALTIATGLSGDRQ